MVRMISTVADLIRLHEGYRRHPYQCSAGKATIGIGRNLDDVGIDEDEASYLMGRDIERAIQHLRLEPYWLVLSPVRQAVLIDMVFNLGWSRFSAFTKLREALRSGWYRLAADEMVDSAWYRQVGNRSKRLTGMMAMDRWPEA